jgi:hypothetical protein
MSVRRLGEHCRNFCIFNTVVLVDPARGREELCLSNFVAGGTGNLVFVDTTTREGRSLSLPSDSGAWALWLWDPETLLVGTCPQRGALHRLDLRHRTWAPELRVEGETYIWNLVRGSDGFVYGGTWPGCALLRYDPASHTLRRLARLSESEADCYSRPIHTEREGLLFIGVGYSTPGIVRWDLASSTFRRFGSPRARIREITSEWICTVGGDDPDDASTLEFHDARTLEPLPSAGRAEKVGRAERELEQQYRRSVRLVAHDAIRRLSDGRAAAPRGQEIVFFSGPDREPELVRIPTTPPATGILTLAADPSGRIWGSSGLGQTVFWYDPRTGESWNSPSVCTSGGEVYGIAFRGGRIYFSAYAGGDHVVYEPDAAWDQINNRNPRTLKPVGPAFIRPEARSVIGPDGAFWTGWMARYGVYGGALSRVDTGDHEVKVWADPVPGQTVGWLAADSRFLYFATAGQANGLPPGSGPFHFVVWHPEGRKAFDHEFGSGVQPSWVACAAGLVSVAVGSELHVFDPARMQFTAALSLEEAPSCVVPWRDGSVAAFVAGKLFECDLLGCRVQQREVVPEGVRTAAAVPSGKLYFACFTQLYLAD